MGQQKFRQAAFVFLFYGILYEGAAYQMWRAGIMPTRFGPEWIWLLIGAIIVGLIVWGLWRWQNPWLARVLCFIVSLRVPAFIGGAFFPRPEQAVPPAAYGVALFVVMVNMWMLARAGWDL